MSAPSSSAVAAVRKAVAKAGDAGMHMTTGMVTAWSSPRATVNIGGTSVPSVYATVQARSSISVGSRVVVLSEGAIVLIIATL